MKLVLLGPPGAGKGTHAEILSKKYQSPHLATGQIFRQHIQEKTNLGVKAKDIIEKGGLVPDQLVNEMMFEEMARLGDSNGFILDGFPRTIGQAQALDQFLKGQKSGLDVVLNFDTTQGMIIERLSGRRICPKCGGNYHLRNIPPKKEGIWDKCGEKLIQRKDDQPDTIQNRLKTYDKETKPLIDYYSKQGLLKDVPGDHDIPELQSELKSLFEELKLAK